MYIWYRSNMCLSEIIGVIIDYLLPLVSELGATGELFITINRNYYYYINVGNVKSDTHGLGNKGEWICIEEPG